MSKLNWIRTPSSCPLQKPLLTRQMEGSPHPLKLQKSLCWLLSCEIRGKTVCFSSITIQINFLLVFPPCHARLAALPDASSPVPDSVQQSGPRPATPWAWRKINPNHSLALQVGSGFPNESPLVAGWSGEPVCTKPKGQNEPLPDGGFAELAWFIFYSKPI